MSKNDSGINPVGERVLVLPDEVEQKTSAGIQLYTDAQLTREQMAQTEGAVVAIGSAAWSDRPAPWASVGQRIIFAKYSGLQCTGSDGKQYRLINDTDVVATKEAANAS